MRVLLPPMVCDAWLLVVGGQVKDNRLCVQEEGCCTSCSIPLPATNIYIYWWQAVETRHIHICTRTHARARARTHAAFREGTGCRCLQEGRSTGPDPLLASQHF